MAAAASVTITVDGVNVSLGGRPVLKDFSCTFSTGVTALVGRNGAGKTTLIRTLCGLVRPSSGDISIGGRKLFQSAAALREVRAGLGWMPQDPPLPSRARVVDVVRYAGWLRGLPSDSNGAIQSALSGVNLTDLAPRRVGSLSGGQQRRVALACALVGRPPVMLLDEPTVGLDPTQRSQFLDVIRDRGKQHTILLSTHLLEDVLGAADQVVVVDDGTVTRSGPLHDLTTSVAGDDPMQMMASLRQAILGDSEAGTQ